MSSSDESGPGLEPVTSAQHDNLNTLSFSTEECMRSMIAFVFSPIFLTNGLAQTWSLPVREIPSPTMLDVAMASADSHGFVVYYNPLTVQRVGPLMAAFFMAHEYGHIYLGHLERMTSVQDPLTRLQMNRRVEIEADEYATRVLARSNPAAIDSVVHQLMNNPHPGDRTHLPSKARALHIRSIANKLERRETKTASELSGTDVPDGMRSTARRMLEHLADESFYSATLDLNDELSNMLAAQQMVHVWNQAIAQLGRFERQYAVEEEDLNSFSRMVIRCKFERGDARVEINFDEEGKIGGLWIRPVND